MSSGRQLPRASAVAMVAFLFTDRADAARAIESSLRLGPELAVAEQGDFPDVAVDGRGQFAVVWRGGTTGVSARVFDEHGIPFGEPLALSREPLRFTAWARVAANERGDFVAAWSEREPIDNPDRSLRVYAQRFDQFGLVSDPIAVTPESEGPYEQSPDVAIAADGGFVVTWMIDLDGFGYRVFAPDGTPVSPALEVTESCDFCYRQPVAMQPSGSFLIGWTVTTAPFQGEVHVRAYARDGSPRGPERRVDGFAGSTGLDSAVADRGGGYRILFFGRDEEGTAWYFRKLRGNGSPLGAPRRVFSANATSPDLPNSSVPAFALDASGRALVTWTHYGATDDDPGGYSIRGAAWSADLSQLTPDRQINQDIDLWQSYAETACNAAGRCVVVWPWEFDDDGRTRVRARQVILPPR